MKAIWIGEQEYEVTVMSDCWHLAKPEDKGRGYLVTALACTCPDFRYRSEKRVAMGLPADCKHMKAFKGETL